jgi:hypothetical protein
MGCPLCVSAGWRFLKKKGPAGGQADGTSTTGCYLSTATLRQANSMINKQPQEYKCEDAMPAAF